MSSKRNPLIRVLLLAIFLSIACGLPIVPEFISSPTETSSTQSSETAEPSQDQGSESDMYLTLTPTPTLAPIGEIQPITNDYAYLGDKDQMALGFNLEGGGAIGSLLWKGRELVDDSDYGRYIQLSPYDGDDTYAALGDDPYGNFGWNPLQSGSKAPVSESVGGTTLEFRRTDDSMYVKTLAKEWGKINQDSDTIYEVWTFLHDGYFEVHTRMTHIGTVYHATGPAEFPAAYFEFDLRNEFTYLGDAPFTGAPMDELKYVNPPGELPGDPSCPNVVPTENWAAFAGQDQVGLILAVPPQKYLSPEWSVCLLYNEPRVGYISPWAFFDFAPGDTREMTYYLIPGPIEAGRRIVYDLMPHTTWNFDLDSREGWRANATPAGIDQGISRVRLSPDDWFTSDSRLNVRGSTAPFVTLRAHTEDQEADICLEYLTLRDRNWSKGRASCLTVSPGDFNDYQFDLHQIPSWEGNVITQLRLIANDPVWLDIDSLEVVMQGYAWEFDNPDEFMNLQEENQLEISSLDQGHLLLKSFGGDPYFSLPGKLSVDAGTSSRIAIRMKVSDGAQAQVFFLTGDNAGFVEDKSQVFDLIADNQFHTYTLDMSTVNTWSGTITKLRFDPTDAAASIDLDYIRIGPKPR